MERLFGPVRAPLHNTDGRLPRWLGAERALHIPLRRSLSDRLHRRVWLVAR